MRRLHPHSSMKVKETLLFSLLGHLLIIGIWSDCVPRQCLKYNCTGENLTRTTPANFCQPCPVNETQCIETDADTLQRCRKDFKVFLNSSRTVDLQEGDTVTFQCVDRVPVPNPVFEWRKDNKTLEGKNKSSLKLKVFTDDAGRYHCIVNSTCGIFLSASKTVTVKDSTLVIVVICGVAAVVLMLFLGLGMKWKLQKEKAEHKRRKEQRAREQQSAPTQMPADS
ncbi:uncharacterized protein LOC115366867 [Myripristis murdjan]|uniref:uncharacterized protein LOC115366867 n=1 Tax=Myripristis murdjan TaxID=586833 RepID=UPI001175F695|nr:uncharacterized protein LOC115366867 [Myripristis murdjan]